MYKVNLRYRKNLKFKSLADAIKFVNDYFTKTKTMLSIEKIK